MNNKNYIVINGKKAELTEEQLEQLGLKMEPVKSVEPERNNPFGKITDNGYYYIANTDVICFTQNINSVFDEDMCNNANYFNDEDFAAQMMLHQQLYRKLLKYAYDNNAEVTEERWKDPNCTKHYIIYNYDLQNFWVGEAIMYKTTTVYFTSSFVAEKAIKDVVKPFMKEHSEFVW